MYLVCYVWYEVIHDWLLFFAEMIQPGCHQMQDKSQILQEKLVSWLLRNEMLCNIDPNQNSFWWQ